MDVDEEQLDLSSVYRNLTSVSGNDDSELDALYQHMVNTVWSNTSGFTRMDVALVGMCRSVCFLSIILAIVLIIHFTGTNLGYIQKNAVYTMVFTQKQPSIIFTVAGCIGLGITAVGFWKGKKIYTYFLIEYAIHEYIRLHDENPTSQIPTERNN